MIWLPACSACTCQVSDHGGGRMGAGGSPDFGFQPDFGSTTPTANHRRPLPLWSGRSGSSRGRRIAQMLMNLWFLHVFCASALVEVRLTTCRSETRAAGSAPHRFALSVLLSRTKRLQCRPSRQHRKVRRAFPELRRNEMGERACSMCGTVRGRLARHSGASGADMGAILG